MNSQIKIYVDMEGSRASVPVELGVGCITTQCMDVFTNQQAP